MRRHSPVAGFAIGAILLAVVLIAAVVAAIAAGSGSSSSVSGREKDRLQASTLVSQAVEINNTIKLIQSQSSLPIEAVSDPDDCSGGADACYALFSPSDGMSQPQVPSILIVADTGGVFANKGEWIYREDVQFQTNSGADVGTTADDGVLFVKGVRDEVCAQLNNIVNDIPVEDGLTEITSGSFNASSTAVYDGDHGDVAFRPMGCNVDTVNEYNFFYAVVDIN